MKLFAINTIRSRTDDHFRLRMVLKKNFAYSSQLNVKLMIVKFWVFARGEGGAERIPPVKATTLLVVPLRGYNFWFSRAESVII